MKKLFSLDTNKRRPTSHRTLIGLILASQACALEHTARPIESDGNPESSATDTSNDSNPDVATVETGVDGGTDTAATDTSVDTGNDTSDAFVVDTGNETYDVVDATNDTPDSVASRDSGVDVIVTDTPTVDTSIPDTAVTPDTVTITDSGSPIRCGRGLIPGYSLSYGIPTGTTVSAEIAAADRTPDSSVIAEINWGDSPTAERIPFDMSTPSHANGNHTYTAVGTVTAVWSLSGMECGRQTFSIVDGTRTRPSCSSFVFDGSDNIRVGESTTLRINAFPRSMSPGDSPLTYHIGNLPTIPNTTSYVGPTTITRITATNPPGAGTYTLSGRACSPRNECATCPSPILTIRP